MGIEKKIEYIFQPTSHTGKEKFMKVLVHYLKSIFLAYHKAFLCWLRVYHQICTKQKQNKKKIEKQFCM